MGIKGFPPGGKPAYNSRVSPEEISDPFPDVFVQKMRQCQSMQNGVVVQLSRAETSIVRSPAASERGMGCRSFSNSEPARRFGPVFHPQGSADLCWERLAAEALYRPARLAVLCNVSLRTLQRHFQRTYGTTLSAWMNTLRLAKAYERILSGEAVKLVAFELGFKQLSHFSRAFKETHGVAPRLIAAQYQSPLAKLLATDLPASEFLPAARGRARSVQFEGSTVVA
jgi:AraC-like DNA-binding protein